MALGQNLRLRRYAWMLLPYVCFCLIHFLKIVNFMQVQAPQIVVQYDYNIYVCIVCAMIYVRATRIVLIPVHLAVFDAAAAFFAAARHFRLVGHDILKED